MRKEQECSNCGMSYTIVYEEDESVEEPSHCPFCGDATEPTSSEDDVDYSEWLDDDY
jgi:predicted Zn-ribbon and HTH transcriptional regulator